MNDTRNVNGTALPTSPATPMPLSDMAMTGPMKPIEMAVTSQVWRGRLRETPASLLGCVSVTGFPFGGDETEYSPSAQKGQSS